MSQDPDVLFLAQEVDGRDGWACPGKLALQQTSYRFCERITLSWSDLKFSENRQVAVQRTRPQNWGLAFGRSLVDFHDDLLLRERRESELRAAPPAHALEEVLRQVDPEPAAAQCADRRAVPRGRTQLHIHPSDGDRVLRC